jgi:hypothetical protein
MNNSKKSMPSSGAVYQSPPRLRARSLSERSTCLVDRAKEKNELSDIDISFRPEDHPQTELSNRILPFVVKLPIGRHKVAKTLIDNGASLNLIMRRMFIEMGLSL